MDFPDKLDSNARVGVRKGTGTTYERRRISLIEGTNVSFTVADDPTSEEVDVTVAVASAAPSGAAGGVLDGTYPNPGLAASVAGAGLTETSDVLAVGAGTGITVNANDVAIDTGVLGGAAWTTVRKTADESVSSSTVLQNDDELFFTAASGTAYEVELVLIYASPVGGGTPDMKIAVGEDATIRGAFFVSRFSVGGAAATSNIGSNQADSSVCGTSATKQMVRVAGTHVGAGSTFRLLWAQDTSDANATTVYAGSVLRYRAIT